MKTIYEIFLQWNNKFFSSEILLLLHFGSCQNVEETELSKEKKLIMKTIYIYIYMWKRNMKYFSKETLIFFFFRKFCFSYILDLAKTVQALRILPQKFTRNFVIKDFWPLKNHVLVNILLCSSHFTEVN